MKKTIRQIVKEIEQIYDDFKKQLAALSDEQEAVLEEFRSKLEEKKIEEIKQTLNNN